MADYYPLLARALDAMPDRSPALREAVYARARGALIGQLRSLDPPLSEDDIDLERNALEAAIQRLEQDHGAPAAPAPTPPEPEPFVPSPANDVADLPEPSRPEPAAAELVATEPPVADAHLPEPNAPEEPQPSESQAFQSDASEQKRPGASLPKATLPPTQVAGPDVGAVPVPPAAAPLPFQAAPLPPEAPPPLPPEVQAPPEPIAPAVRIQARKGKSPPFVAPATPEAADPSIDAPGASAEPSVLDGNGQRQRPRIEVVTPRAGRSRLLRNLLVGSILLVVIGLIAVAAFLLRDKPADLQPVASEIQENAQDGAESKFADRVGGEAAPTERQAQARRPTAPATPSPVSPQNETDLAIAQRAMLYEEKTSATSNTPPNATQGRVVWRLDTVPGEQGQPLETVVRAKADFPDAGFSLAMTLRRNLDASLPASHTIELVFTETGPNAAQHAVQDIGLLQGKDEEGARGSPVAGLPVRVRENLFLIGLSSLPNDIERNTDILLRKNWFDVTLKFNSGLRGIVAFEKGGAGTQVLQKAFDQWR